MKILYAQLVYEILQTNVDLKIVALILDLNNNKKRAN